MKTSRYYKHRRFLRNDTIHDKYCYKFLNIDEVVDLLNRLEDDRQFLKELKIEYKRVNNILEDFMTVTNRLQANPNDTTSQSIARDMLIMMGKEVMEHD